MRFDWTKARDDAEERGGHLATITSEEEWNIVRNYFINYPGNVSAFLGGIRRDKDGDGTPDIGIFNSQDPLALKAGSENWEWITGELGR